MVVADKKSPSPLGLDYSGWKGFVLELVAFAFTAFMIIREGWSPTDLVWALWLASLVVGWAIIISWLFGSFQRGKTGNIGIAIFFTFHFSFFHFVHAVFLTVFFPPTGNGILSSGDPGNLFSQIPELITSTLAGSAFFVMATVMARFGEIRTALKVEKLNSALSYASVIKMHIMIIFLGFVIVLLLGSSSTGLDAFNSVGLKLIMIIVLIFHFFPFEAFRYHWKNFRKPT